MATPVTERRVHSPTLLLPRLAKQVFRLGGEEALGMPIKHVLALSYLQDTGGSPQQELGEALGVDANMVVLVLNELEERGYVQRQRDSRDRRRHQVQITADGITALKRTEPAQRAISDEVLRALDADERATLADLLSRALAGLERAD